MAFKRSAVRSRLSPPKKHRFYLESVLFSNFFRFSVLLGQRKSQQNQPFLPFVPSKGGQNGLHSGKVKREEDCFLQIQGLRGSGRQWQADFQVYDLVSPCGTHTRKGSEGSPKGGGYAVLKEHGGEGTEIIDYVQYTKEAIARAEKNAPVRKLDLKTLKKK